MENEVKTKKHWVVLAAAAGMAGSSLGININTIGVFYTPVADSLGVYRGTFALHSTIAALSIAIVSLYIPKILTIHRFKTILRFGVALATTASIAMAFTSQMWVFYILGALRGIGSGLFALVPLTTLLNNWFEEKNGLAMSLAFGSAGVVGAVMSPVFTYLIQIIGWRYSFIVMGLCIAVLCMPGLFLPYEFHPRDDGLLPYGMKSEAGEENNQTKISVKGLDKKPVSYFSVPFIVLFLLAYLHTSLIGIYQHLPGFAESINLSSNIGAFMLSAVMIGNISFKLIIGFLGEYLGTIKTVVLMIGINFISVLLMIFIQTPVVLIFSAFLFGSVFCIPPVGLPLLTNYFFGRTQAYRVYPLISFSSGVGGALSMSLVGYIFDFTGSYAAAFWIAIAFHIVNLSLLAFGLKNVQTEAK